MPTRTGNGGEFVDLLNQARAGSPVALGRILLLMEPVLRHHLRGQVKPRLAAWVQESDFIQDTFAEAQRSLGDFRGETVGEFAAWLVRIQLNLLVGFRRRNVDCRKRHSGELQLLDGPDSARLREQLIDTRPSPVDAAIHAEEQAAADEVLSTLPPTYRAVVCLRVWEGRSFVEAGGCLRRSADAVRKLWGRAVQQLREHYPDQPQT